MKKILLLFLCVFFIGCVSFPEVEYIGDAYYPDKGYFKMFAGGASLDGRFIYFDFRTISGTDKVIVIARKSFDSIVTVSKTDKVLFKFTDGKELVLNYNSRVSQYENGNFELTATSGVIEDFGTLEIVRMETDDGYMNFEASKEGAKSLINDFNMIKEQATAMYGASE